jgi:PAS domain S-box-containing protein
MKIERERIRELLKSNPSGMTISDLARKLDLNRNTVARYLDILLTAGEVEMRQIGSAKLYSLSHRVPIAALLDASSSVIAVLNKNLMILQANDSLSKLLNIEKSDLIGMTLLESLSSTQSGSEIESRVRESIEGRYSTTEVKLKTGNESVFLNISSLPIILGDGTNGACLIAEDITDNKKMEQALSESESKYRTLVNAMGDMIFVIDKDDYLVQVHTSKYDIIPIQKDTIVGQHVSEISSSDATKEILRAAQDVRATTEPRSVEFSQEVQKTLFWFSAVLTLHEDGGSVVILVRDISKQKAAELELEKSERKFRTVFENAGIGITVVDSDNRFIDINPAYQEMLGYSRDEILERTWMDFTHPDDLESEIAQADEMLRLDQDLFRIEKRCIGKDGTIAWINLTVNVVRDSEDNSHIYISMVDDITQQKLAEEALRESEDRFRATFYESPIGINIFDSEGALIHANRTLLDLFGIQNEDAVKGLNIFEDPNLSEEIKRKMRAAETVRVENTIDFDEIVKAGFYRTSKVGKAVLDTVVGPMGIDEDGTPTGFIIQVNDITERNIANEKLEETSKFYKTILDKIVDGVMVHDRNDEITYINEAGLKIIGLQKEQILGTNILEGFPKDSLTMAWKIYSEAKKNLEPKRFDTISVTSPIGQQLYQSGWVIPLFKDGQYNGMIATIEDITSQVTAIEEKHQNTEFLQNVMESLQYPFYVIDAESHIIKIANSAAGFGQLNEDSTCYRLIHQRELPCDGVDHTCILEKVKKTKKPLKLEHIHTDENGEVRTFEIHARPILDSEGKVTRIIEFDIDLTEQRKVENELRVNESRYQSLFENSSISYWEEDFSQVKEFFDRLRDDGVTDFRDHFANNPEDVEQCVNLVRVLDVNKASMKLLGIQKKDEMLGSLTRNFEKDRLGVFREDLIALAEGRTIFQSDDVQLSVRGERHVLAFQINVQPGFEESLSRVHRSIIDKTSRSDTQKTLRKGDAADTTDQTQRMTQMEEQLRNERLLRGVTERFFQSSSLEQSIPQSLSDIGIHLNVDRVGVFCFDPDTMLGAFKYEWCAKGVPRILSKVQDVSINDFPWWAKQTPLKESIYIVETDTIPSKREDERNILQLLDIKSLVAVPFHKGLDFHGFIGVSTSKRREYSEAERSLLQNLTHIIGQAMEVQ